VAVNANFTHIARMPRLSGWRSAPASAARSPLDGRRLAFWYGVFAVSAGILYLIITRPEQRTWGSSAERDSVAAVPGAT
jgi:hypothetical protein